MYTYLEGQLIQSEVVHQIRAPMLKLVLSSPCAHCLTFDSLSTNFIYEAVQYFFKQKQMHLLRKAKSSVSKYI